VKAHDLPPISRTDKRPPVHEQSTFVTSGLSATLLGELLCSLRGQKVKRRPGLGPASLFGRGLRTWSTVFQEFDLAVVVGFVFGNMKPLGVIVR
jgi:hypothetical protein